MESDLVITCEDKGELEKRLVEAAQDIADAAWKRGFRRGVAYAIGQSVSDDETDREWRSEEMSR